MSAFVTFRLAPKQQQMAATTTNGGNNSSIKMISHHPNQMLRNFGQKILAQKFEVQKVWHKNMNSDKNSRLNG